MNVRMEVNTTFYILKLGKMLAVAKNHPWLAQTVLTEIGKAESLKNREESPLDFVRGTKIFYDDFDMPLDAKESKVIFSALDAFKSAVVTRILKNRRDRKVKNLRKILQEFIALAKKRKEQAKELKRRLEFLPLEDQLN